MTDLITRLRAMYSVATIRHSQVANPPVRHIITARGMAYRNPDGPEAAAAIAELVEALEWISTNYENGHLNHVDYRVQAKHLADAALARVRTQETTI